MDKLDKQILTLLADNARMPVKEIAKKISLTSPAVSSRIRRMEADGIIKGYTVRLKLPENTNQVSALISVSMQPSQHEEFIKMLNEHNEIMQCFHVTGSHSFLSMVQCENMQALEHLITSFQRIGPTSTQIILSTPVDRREPLI